MITYTIQMISYNTVHQSAEGHYWPLYHLVPCITECVMCKKVMEMFWNLLVKSEEKKTQNTCLCLQMRSQELSCKRSFTLIKGPSKQTSENESSI